MKGWLFLLIILAFSILLSGCTTQTQLPTTTTQLQTTKPQSDPIVGIWTQDLTLPEDTSPFIVTYTFFEDSRFNRQSQSGQISGQWVKIRENQYVVSYSFQEKTNTYIYDPITDTLNQPDYPELNIYRAGKMPSQTVNPAIAPVTSAPQSPNRYNVGDKIQRANTDSAYDKDRAWVILKINYDEEKYTIGKLYYDPDGRKWYKVNEDLPEIRFFSAVERDYPNLIGKINWDTVPIKYTIHTCEGTTVLSYDSEQPECGTGGSSSSSTDGVISGYGDDVIPLNVQTAGLYIFSMSHSGRSNFIVWVKGGDGYNQDLLVNEIGHYSGKKSTRLEKGKYYLDITADGYWTITIGS